MLHSYFVMYRGGFPCRQHRLAGCPRLQSLYGKAVCYDPKAATDLGRSFIDGQGQPV